MISTTPNLTIRIANSIHAIDPKAWDALSAGRPFQSHRWYQFGEKVLQDCEPTYLLAYDGESLVGRASFWVIRNEPLPLGPGAGRTIIQWILRHWPLFVCRSPLSSASGLLLPSGPARVEALNLITKAAGRISEQKRCSFLLFDFISQEEGRGWSDEFSLVTVSDPGMVLHNPWSNLDSYLAAGKARHKRYRQFIRETQKLGVTIDKRKRVADVPAALALIEKVDRRHHNSPTPWMRELLVNLEMANGIWLEAWQHGKRVGCGALFEDNEAQVTIGLGLSENVPYAYLALLYASLEDAIQKEVRLLRWGSGAYEIKRRLGFVEEPTNHTMVASHRSVLRWALKRFV